MTQLILPFMRLIIVLHELYNFFWPVKLLDYKKVINTNNTSLDRFAGNTNYVELGQSE